MLMSGIDSYSPPGRVASSRSVAISGCCKARTFALWGRKSLETKEPLELLAVTNFDMHMSHNWSKEQAAADVIWLAGDCENLRRKEHTAAK